MTRQTSTNLAEFFHCPSCHVRLIEMDPDNCNSASQRGASNYVTGFGFRCHYCKHEGCKDIVVDFDGRTASIEVEFELPEEEPQPEGATT